MHVSILILLEVPLQLEIPYNTPFLSKSFNPYFTGSTTSTGYNGSVVIPTCLFQSLFYWKYHFNHFSLFHDLFISHVSILILLEVPLQLAVFFRYFKICISFQSLFYWKYHFNIYYHVEV